MLKKIALLIMLVLPMGVFAQSTLKFGHMNSTDIIPTMPEYTKAISELQALEKNYTDEIQRTQAEFTKKYQEFQQAIAKILYRKTLQKEDRKNCRIWLKDKNNSSRKHNRECKKHSKRKWLLYIRS